jgi:hypothetical protein
MSSNLIIGSESSHARNGSLRCRADIGVGGANDRNGLKGTGSAIRRIRRSRK